MTRDGRSTMHVMVRVTTAGVYLVSINRSRYSAVHGGGHAKTALLYAAISAAAHQRRRRHGLKMKSATQIRLRRISVLDEYDYLSAVLHTAHYPAWLELSK
jgi:hypothetical protein